MEMGNESKCPTVSCCQEAMSDDQKFRQFSCPKWPMEASGRYLGESLGSGGSGTNYHRPFHALCNDSGPLRAKGQRTSYVQAWPKEYKGPSANYHLRPVKNKLDFASLWKWAYGKWRWFDGKIARGRQEVVRPFPAQMRNVKKPRKAPLSPLSFYPENPLKRRGGIGQR